MKRQLLAIPAVLLFSAWTYGATVVEPAKARFQSAESKEAPDFQKHVLPLMGRLGCNGRACHGSFQGAGGFRLSLFGYDFKMDHEALTKGDSPRVLTDDPEGSKIIEKPTLAIPHKGGKRMEPGGWEYNLFMRWVSEGAKAPEKEHDFAKLEVIPAEIVFKGPNEKVQLKVLAHWADGTVEDVTCLCRYRTNDESIAEIDADGLVVSKGKGDSAVVAFYDNGVGVTDVVTPITDLVGNKYPKVETPTRIDELIVQKLRKLGIVPSTVCTDEEFLRRVSLDIVGTLPAPKEVREFLADKSPDKRAKKVNELLDRPAYAAWWATKFCDWTGNNARVQGDQGFRPQFTEQWYSWIEKRIRENMPYDKIVEGIVLAKSREPGESAEDFFKNMTECVRPDGTSEFANRQSMPHYWSRTSLRGAPEKALNFSYSFLAVRLECAQCHKHPFDQWTQQDFNQFTAFFAPITYNYPNDTRDLSRKMLDDLGLSNLRGGEQYRKMAELVREGKTVPFREVFVPVAKSEAPRAKGKQKQNTQGSRTLTPKLLGGDEVVANQYPDPRVALMEWMRDEDNPYFSRGIVNRVWANYFNVGISEPTDDQNLANPPSNRALLDYLAKEFVKKGYDLKWLHREITSSRAYQLSWTPNETNKLDTRNFSHAIPRRLPAEVAIDAVKASTGSDADFEKFCANVKDRAIAQADSGYQGAGRGNSNFALKVFGKPDRTTICDCERGAEPTLLQSIYLSNDQETLNLLDRKDGWLHQLSKMTGEPLAATGDANAQRRNAEEARKRMAELQKEIAEVQKKIDERGGKDNKDKVAKDLQQKLRGLRADQKQLLASVGGRDKDKGKPEAEKNEEKPVVAGKLDADKVIEDVYLRSLSRFPTPEEFARCRQHMAQAKSTVAGARDLLWALLNTKEFVVNH